MRRLLPTLAITLLATASCSDQSVLPVSTIAPTQALKDREGDPPPPPVAGDGFADFSAFLGDAEALQSADVCSASDSFQLAFEYLLNKPGNNAFLHLRVDGRALDVSAHQTDKKLDVKGTITGPGFTFDIQQTLGGSIINGETRVPSTVSFQLVGKLTKTSGFTCTANANLTVHLSSSDIILD